MYKNLYEWMVPRIGTEAARAGLRMQYSNVFLATVVWGGIIIVYTGGGRFSIILMGAYCSLLLAVVVGIYTRILFARALTKHFKAKVRWYRLPFLTQPRLFDKWLEEIENDPNSKS